jgi:NADH-quinone oxidoreductase subunit C
MAEMDGSAADAALKELGDGIAAALPGVVREIVVRFGELTLSVDAARILDVLRHLRDAPAGLFISFIDITAVDYPARDERFDVVYHLLSPHHNRRIRIKAAVADGEPVASATAVFPAADWYERETYDLFGIFFSGHPDLRRILTDYGFDGHPLRKDFPMTGFVELRYDDEQKRVVYEPVRLSQEYRQFDFLSPWEGGTPYTLPGDEKAGRS